MSIAHKGRKFTAEHRAKIARARTGCRHSAEAKAKVGAANRGRHIKGRPMTAEHKAKLLAINTGRYCPPETRAKLSTKAKQPRGPMTEERKRNISIARLEQNAKRRQASAEAIQ